MTKTIDLSLGKIAIELKKHGLIDETGALKPEIKEIAEAARAFLLLFFVLPALMATVLVCAGSACTAGIVWLFWVLFV